MPVRQQGERADRVEPPERPSGSGLSSKTPGRFRTGFDQNPSTRQSPAFSSTRAASNERRRFAPSRTSMR